MSSRTQQLLHEHMENDTYHNEYVLQTHDKFIVDSPFPPMCRTDDLFSLQAQKYIKSLPVMEKKDFKTVLPGASSEGEKWLFSCCSHTVGHVACSP